MADGNVMWTDWRNSVVRIKEDTGKRKKREDGKTVKVMRYKYQVNIHGTVGWRVHFESTESKALACLEAAREQKA